MSTIPDLFKKYCILPLYDHQPAPSNAIAVGDYNSIMANLPGAEQHKSTLLRADALMSRVEATEAEQALVRAAQIAMFADSITTLSRRLDAFVHRRDEQARRDAEQAEREEKERIDAELATLPDPDDPNYAPGGLTPTGPTTPEHERRLAAIEDEEQHQGEDVIEDNRLTAPADDQGALPEELVKEAPPEQGNTAITSMRLKDPASLGYPRDPPEQAQPVSVSRNAED